MIFWIYIYVAISWSWLFDHVDGICLFVKPPSPDSKHQYRYNYQRQLIRAAKHRLEEGANSSRAWHGFMAYAVVDGGLVDVNRTWRRGLTCAYLYVLWGFCAAAFVDLKYTISNLWFIVSVIYDMLLIRHYGYTCDYAKKALFLLNNIHVQLSMSWCISLAPLVPSVPAEIADKLGH